MKKFEIIEEGRLSKSEMNQVQGGSFIGCTGVYILTCCDTEKGCTVSCESSYFNDGTGGACKSNYTGKPMLAPNYNTDNLVIKNPGSAIDNAITATLKPRP